MISGSYLRRLVESVLLESVKDDQRYLIGKNPDLTNDLKNLPPKWITWLAARFGESPSRKEVHPIRDAIVTVKKFATKDAAIGEKYRSSEQFRSVIDDRFSPARRGWSSPSDATTMTVDDMETILGFAERRKQRIEINVSEEEMESDRVGKVGPWNLWMPTDRERSCKIAGYDPVTLEPKTTWCTARMAGSNLFYSYVARPNANIVLFYIIRDDPSLNADWLSVGFVSGRPELTGQYGGVSVDRANNGLTQASLREILGSDNDEIMRILAQKSESLGGRHPAKEKIKAAAKDPKALEHLLRGLSDDERDDLLSFVVDQPGLSPEVMVHLANSSRLKDRHSVALNKKLPVESILKLANDQDSGIREAMAMNKSTDPETLIKLVNDPNKHVRFRAAGNPKLPTAELLRLVQAGDDSILNGAMTLPEIPPEVADMASRHEYTPYRHSIAVKESLPVAAMERLSEDPSPNVRSALVINPKLPPEILLKLSKDPDRLVRMNVAYSHKASNEMLQDLLNDPEPIVRDTAKKNIKKRLKVSKGKKLDESTLRQLIRRML